MKKYQIPRNDFNFGDENRFENTSLVMKTLAKVKKKISKALSLSQVYTSWNVQPFYVNGIVNGHTEVCSIAVILVL